jgi:hypothetical protein
MYPRDESVKFHRWVFGSCRNIRSWAYRILRPCDLSTLQSHQIRTPHIQQRSPWASRDRPDGERWASSRMTSRAHKLPLHHIPPKNRNAKRTMAAACRIAPEHARPRPRRAWRPRVPAVPGAVIGSPRRRGCRAEPGLAIHRAHIWVWYLRPTAGAEQGWDVLFFWAGRKLQSGDVVTG